MSRKSGFWLAMALALAVGLAPAVAEAARAGGGSSIGSRGARTYQAVPSTPTAPSTRPVERSTTTQRQATQPATQPTAPATAPATGSFFQRNPFMAGMMGGLIGVGLGGLLFGNGFFGGLNGFAGFLGLLLQGALIAGLVYLVIAFIRRRSGGEAPRPAHAYAGGYGANETAQRGTAERRAVMDVAPIDIASGKVGAAPSAAPGAAPLAARDEVGIGEADYAEFERLLVEIQDAWSKGDLAALRRHATPEMLSYFSEQLSASVSEGLENRVEDVKFDSGDLAEAWREGNVDYATVAMRWTARDYAVKSDSGAVVEGSATEPVAITEVWTFLRSRGGRWLLSAIQQV